MPRSRRHRPHEHRHRPRRAAAALATALTLLAALATACASDPDLDPGPPAPAQVTSTAPAAIPTAGDPVITVAPQAGQFADDPAVTAFRELTDVSVSALRSSGTDRSRVDEVMTGTRFESFLSELDDYQTNGWVFLGTPTWKILGVTTIDETHKRIITCEFDSASYPATEDGRPVHAVEDDWLPYEHWMILIEGKWKLEYLYTAGHSCEEVS